jgi:hypothetical protein
MHTHQETFDIGNALMIKQGHPGWDAEKAQCQYSAGCAAAQFMTPEQRTACDTTPGYKSANARIPAGFIRAANHDPDFVYGMQVIHDIAAENARGDIAQWRAEWLPRVIALAKDQSLSITATLQVGRDAGWADVPADVEGA